MREVFCHLAFNSAQNEIQHLDLTNIDGRAINLRSILAVQREEKCSLLEWEHLFFISRWIVESARPVCARPVNDVQRGDTKQCTRRLGVKRRLDSQPLPSVRSRCPKRHICSVYFCTFLFPLLAELMVTVSQTLEELLLLSLGLRDIKQHYNCMRERSIVFLIRSFFASDRKSVV